MGCRFGGKTEKKIGRAVSALETTEQGSEKSLRLQNAKQFDWRELSTL